MASLNLIRVFDVYLIITFVLSVVMRYRQYRELLDLILAVPGRWPKLFQLATEHRSLFLSWPTLIPIIVTFSFMVLQNIASNFIWHSATVTPKLVVSNTWLLTILAGLGVAMVALDMWAVFNVGRIDRVDLEKKLDQAEYWLKSWVGGAVKVITLGYVNPRKMVADEVRNNLAWLSGEMSKMMWQWSVQVAVRLGFGLTLWLTWALSATPAP